MRRNTCLQSAHLGFLLQVKGIDFFEFSFLAGVSTDCPGAPLNCYPYQLEEESCLVCLKSSLGVERSCASVSGGIVL